MLLSQFAVKFPMKFVSRSLKLVMSPSSEKNAIVYLIMYALNCKKENVPSLRDQFRKMFLEKNVGYTTRKIVRRNRISGSSV